MTSLSGEGRLAGRIALVTGASRGIGAAVAKRFAAEGAHVVLVARTQGGLEEVDDAIRAARGDGEDTGATLVPLDLTDYDEIDRMGAALYERFGRLDVLVGNAGILGELSPLGHIEPSDWDAVMATNLTANWRLIRSLDPLLQASEAGRAIFVSSGVARKVFPYWGGYAVSKAALEMLVKIYASENEQTNVNANILDPATVRTGMRAKAMPGEDPMTLPTPDAITEDFVTLAEASCSMNGEVVRVSS
ncbi:MAG: SDR family NAD(P)-dependent oxidoreductase [Alphaproteobacteria bacterium]